LQSGPTHGWDIAQRIQRISRDAPQWSRSRWPWAKEMALRRILLIKFFSLTVLFMFLPQWLVVAQTETVDDKIKGILQDRVDRAKISVGIVVGLIDETGTRIVGYGKPSQDSAQMVDGDSVFEIGSITKVFTAILLADMVERGEVSLSDPISKYLPKSVK